MRIRVVVSAVNIVEGGTLTVLRDCLAELALRTDVEVIALVNDTRLIEGIDVQALAFPAIKGSWLRRISFEYLACKSISERLKADIWMALHDMTPRVHARKLYVYTHNPMWQYRMRIYDIWYDPKLLLFSWFYRYLYRINIQQADAVIVQQRWLQREFESAFKPRKVIVAHPVLSSALVPGVRPRRLSFCYPSLARPFKNHEILLKAWGLAKRNPCMRDAVLHLTLDGSEGRLAADLRRRHGTLHGVVWHGRLPKAKVERLLQDSDCLVFPSRIETWGLPMSEARTAGLHVIAADEPYAHEVLNGYPRTTFVPTDQVDTWAKALIGWVTDSELSSSPRAAKIQPPDADSWKSLWEQLLSGLRS